MPDYMSQPPADPRSTPAPEKVEPRPCRLCGRRILFVRNPHTGNTVPVDAGEATVYRIVRSLTNELELELVRGVHLGHHQTCPNLGARAQLGKKKRR